MHPAAAILEALGNILIPIGKLTRFLPWVPLIYPLVVHIHQVARNDEPRVCY